MDVQVTFGAGEAAFLAACVRRAVPQYRRDGLPVPAWVPELQKRLDLIVAAAAKDLPTVMLEPEPEQHWVTVADAARLGEVSQQAIREQVRKGRLSANAKGWPLMVDADEVLAMREERERRNQSQAVATSLLESA